jgi:hypothetical protein
MMDEERERILRGRKSARGYLGESVDYSLFGRIGFGKGWKSMHQIPRRAEFLE